MSAPRERGIMFTAENAAKVRAGTKTQTRRVLPFEDPDRAVLGQFKGGVATFHDAIPDDPCPIERRCKYGTPGDRLWVREPCVLAPKRWTDNLSGLQHVIDADGDARVIQYLADQSDLEAARDYGLRPRPSMFMPRWASRTLLEIVTVKVERLQDLSEVDALAEGITFKASLGDHGWYEGALHPIKGTPKVYPTAVLAFRSRWDALYHKKPEKQWDASPWVSAISFRRIG